MKKIFLALLVLAGFAASAQLSAPYYLHSPRATLNGVTSKGAIENARDSVNSGTTVLAPTTSYNYAQVDSTLVGLSYKASAIEFSLKKVSGTVAGSLYLQGSVDGASWTNIEDTLTLTNTTTKAYFWQTPHRLTEVGINTGTSIYTNPTVMTWLYYRVFISGTGTWCGTFNTCISPRQ